MNAQFPHVNADVRPLKYETGPCLLDSDSLLSISSDVHDMWRSTLEAGEGTPFMPDVMHVDGGDIDIANTASRALPESLQKVSVASGAIILSMINTQLSCRDEVDSMHIEKMSINLFSMWNVIKHNQPLSLERGQQYPSASSRVKILDQRLVLAGVASLLDEERYPVWGNYYHLDRVRELPGVLRYGEQGRKILDIVRTEQRPVAIGSELDRLY